MRPRLIILSDLWGDQKSEWMDYYFGKLKPFFEIVFYDSRSLADLDVLDKSEESIHSQFVDGGIERAVRQICKLEKQAIQVLAFSVGGTIAWKAALKGLPVGKLYAVSSTRLRYESTKPSCNCELFFGDKDQYKPSWYWIKNMDLDGHFISGKEHEMYRDVDFADLLCCKINEEQVEASK